MATVRERRAVIRWSEGVPIEVRALKGEAVSQLRARANEKAWLRKGMMTKGNTVTFTIEVQEREVTPWVRIGGDEITDKDDGSSSEGSTP